MMPAFAVPTATASGAPRLSALPAARLACGVQRPLVLVAPSVGTAVGGGGGRRPGGLGGGGGRDGEGGGDGGRAGGFGGWWGVYNARLVERPLRTKALTAGVLVAVSDVVAQIIGGGTWDMARIARFGVYGLFCAGPQGHFWFAFLDKVVKTAGTRGAVVKTLIDQLAFSPLAIAGFFVAMQLMEGQGLKDAGGFAKDNLWPTLSTSLKFWPALNVFNFSVVPPAQRVLFTSAASVVWITFLSVIANKAPQAEPVPATL